MESVIVQCLVFAIEICGLFITFLACVRYICCTVIYQSYEFICTVIFQQHSRMNWKILWAKVMWELNNTRNGRFVEIFSTKKLSTHRIKCHSVSLITSIYISFSNDFNIIFRSNAKRCNYQEKSQEFLSKREEKIYSHSTQWELSFVVVFNIVLIKRKRERKRDR